MRLFCTGCALALGSFLACAGTAVATTITPTVTTDDLVNNGNCTLREAIQAANTDAKVDHCPAGSGADVIRLGAHTYTVSGHLDITAPATIAGAGSVPTTIDAVGRDRVFVIDAGAPTTVQDLTLTGGHPGRGGLGAPGGNGGAIEASSPLTLTNVNVDSSSAGDGTAAGTVLPGGPGGNGTSGGDGGGIWSNAALTITGGSFASDHAGNGSAGLNGGDASTAGTPGGAGGAGGRGGSGGAIAVAGGAQLRVTGTTFSNDSAGNGGTGGNGAAALSGAGADGGRGGNGGPGGSGGAISSDGQANITGISTGQTRSGAGGAGGVGGRGGAGSGGSTPPDGDNGTSGSGGDGGIVSAGIAALMIAGSTLTNGSAGAGGAGPAVSSAGSADQTRTGGPGSGGDGGAISAIGPVSIDHATMSFDHAGNGGAGGDTLISAYPGGAGGSGGAVDGGDVTVTNSTVSGSAAGAGGAGGTGATAGPGGPGGGGGGVHASGTIALRNSTLDHDSAGTGGAGAAASPGHAGASGGNGGAGGGVLADGAGTIDDVTMFADKAGDGGAGGSGSGARPGGTGGAGGDGGSVRGASPSLALLHMTVVGGMPGAGGAGPAGSGAAGATGGLAGAGTLAASVLSGNAGPQCSGTQNGGGNVNVPDSTCGGLVADPRLGPLGSHGGPAQTFLPAPGSPVLDMIPPGGATCSSADPDERGAPRPQGPDCDSGAVEAANPALSAVPSPVSFSSIPSGRRATTTITIHASFDPVTPAPSLTGTDARSFSLSGNRCARHALVPLGACTLLVTFRSSGARGARHATLRVTHDRSGPPLDLPLIGTVGASAPVISRLSLSNPAFAVTLAETSRVNATRRAPKGTIVAFRLSEPATVELTVQQRAVGRLRRERCVAPTSPLATAKHCTRSIVRGSFSRRRVAGINHVVFSGRFRRGALAPGRYTLVLTPTAFGHIRGRSRSIGFTIVRG